jgi:hypothetical protein
MSSTDHYNEDDGDKIADLLVGRKIVRAEMGAPDDEGMLVLDDGTQLLLSGHEGCGGCSSGWYGLEHVATVDNVITRAEVRCDPGGECEDGEGLYQIFVFTGATEINVATFQGTDGNGYYGTGFSISVVRKEGED